MSSSSCHVKAAQLSRLLPGVGDPFGVRPTSTCADAPAGLTLPLRAHWRSPEYNLAHTNEIRIDLAHGGVGAHLATSRLGAVTECQVTDFEMRFSVLIEMFVTWISFCWTFKSFWDLTEVSEQSWYKVLTDELVNPTFKISLLRVCGFDMMRLSGLLTQSSHGDFPPNTVL